MSGKVGFINYLFVFLVFSFFLSGVTSFACLPGETGAPYGCPEYYEYDDICYWGGGACVCISGCSGSTTAVYGCAYSNEDIIPAGQICTAIGPLPLGCESVTDCGLVNCRDTIPECNDGSDDGVRNPVIEIESSDVNDCIDYFNGLADPNSHCADNEVAVKQTCDIEKDIFSNFVSPIKAYVDCFDLSGYCGSSGRAENHTCVVDDVNKDAVCVVSKNIDLKAIYRTFPSDCNHLFPGLYSQEGAGCDDIIQNVPGSLATSVTVYTHDEFTCTLGFGDILGAEFGTSTDCPDGKCFFGKCVTGIAVNQADPKDLQGVVGGPNISISGGQTKILPSHYYFCGDQVDYIKVKPVESGLLNISTMLLPDELSSDLDVDLYFLEDDGSGLASSVTADTSTESISYTVVANDEYLIKVDVVKGQGNLELTVSLPESGSPDVVYAPGIDGVEYEFNFSYDVEEKGNYTAGDEITLLFVNGTNFIISCETGAPCESNPSSCRDPNAATLEGCKVNMTLLASENFLKNVPSSLSEWSLGTNTSGSKILKNTDFRTFANYERNTELANWVGEDKWLILLVGPQSGDSSDIYSIYPFTVESRGASNWWDEPTHSQPLLDPGERQELEYEFVTGPVQIRKAGGSTDTYWYLVQVRNGLVVKAEERWTGNLHRSGIHPEDWIIGSADVPFPECDNENEVNIINVYYGGGYAGTAPCASPSLRAEDVADPSHYSPGYADWCLLSSNTPLSCGGDDGGGGGGVSPEPVSPNAPTVSCTSDVDSPDPVSPTQNLDFILDNSNVNDLDGNTLRVFVCSTADCGGLSADDLLSNPFGGSSTVLTYSTVDCGPAYSSCSSSYVVSESIGTDVPYYLKAVESVAPEKQVSLDMAASCGVFHVRATSGPVINSFAPERPSIDELKQSPTDFLLDAVDPDGGTLTYVLYDETSGYPSDPEDGFRQDDGTFAIFNPDGSDPNGRTGEIFVTEQGYDEYDNPYNNAVVDYLPSRDPPGSFPYTARVCVKVTDIDGEAIACADIEVTENISGDYPPEITCNSADSVVLAPDSLAVDYDVDIDTSDAVVRLYGNEGCSGPVLHEFPITGSGIGEVLSYAVSSSGVSRVTRYCLEVVDDNGETDADSCNLTTICTPNCEGGTTGGGICIDVCGSHDPDCGPDAGVPCGISIPPCCQIGCLGEGPPPFYDPECSGVIPLINVSINLPPVADAGFDQYAHVLSGGAKVEIVLDGSSSFDPDGEEIVSYNWSKLEKDGSVSEIYTGETITGVELGVGSHVFELVVVDAAGTTDPTHVDSDIVYVTVIEEPVKVNTPESNPLLAAIFVLLASMVIFARKSGKTKE